MKLTLRHSNPENNQSPLGLFIEVSGKRVIVSVHTEIDVQASFTEISCDLGKDKLKTIIDQLFQ